MDGVKTNMSIKIKKDGTPSLLSFDKTLRNVIKENMTELTETIVANFAKEVAKPKATKADVETALSSNGNSIFLCSLASQIRYTADNSIDRRSLPKPFRTAYNEAEKNKKAEFEKALKEKLSDTKNITLEELIKINEKSRQMKKPFSGKFN